MRQVALVQNMPTYLYNRTIHACIGTWGAYHYNYMHVSVYCTKSKNAYLSLKLWQQHINVLSRRMHTFLWSCDSKFVAYFLGGPEATLFFEGGNGWPQPGHFLHLVWQIWQHWAHILVGMLECCSIKVCTCYIIQICT